MDGFIPSGLAADLQARGLSGKPIRIGLIGSGMMGGDIVTQVLQMRGIVVAAIADIHLPAAVAALKAAGGALDSHRIVQTQGAFDQAVHDGRIAVTQDAQLVCRSGLIDVVVDATGKPAVGAEIGLLAMEHGKHLVMMNVEADVTIGAYLKREADRLGVVYSLGAGDEPSATIELIGFVSALGYPVIAAGKGKNNPLNFDATPDDYAAQARLKHLNPRLLVEFVDGSKTAVEMSAIANATGLVPDIPGMHGPAARLDDLHKVLCPVADGGLLQRKGVVDYTIGKGVAPGVFVVAEMAHPRLRERMDYLQLGTGPYYTFYRPYHLCSLEVPLTCARAVLYGRADMAPIATPTAEVCAVAKRDLYPGGRLDAIGEYTYRAWAMTVADARRQRAVPCGLLEQGTVLQPIRKGELLTYANSAVDAGSRIVELRRRQDELIHGKQGAVA
ncbi:NAD(P)H-dependent oxidoreductase [Verminephrobacter eiseniae]|uniref:NAD(P)H-dependent oxidoreductase n=1 Tax=Verminephrobacter eiseniae TaxID=364317 RepID=UPI0010DE181C|nr:homoserine dehydrogenase [Verminephrobacter eiseniae]KAB7590669.1 homoserine dehydrogenase [Verminephrobacter sp. Larva24]MCW5230029.1 homoserine dehydrogenase [Verminephrobacter eiseniae]MCW5291761.1 homoserine dehydrogenase [Verminephrobacter eiseniae]MCW8186284.1 homoserine dehydrogenase [Verminephrobacter eiseniae]MCW8224742.1 homoserine dehydrogenase [Verminephrobacter eiseniae]